MNPPAGKDRGYPPRGGVRGERRAVYYTSGTRETVRGTICAKRAKNTKATPCATFTRFTPQRTFCRGKTFLFKGCIRGKKEPLQRRCKGRSNGQRNVQIFGRISCHLPVMARSILASRFLIGHFEHCGMLPGWAMGGATALAPAPCATAFPFPITETVGVVLSIPRSQSAEQEWTRQMVARMSAPGTVCPVS